MGLFVTLAAVSRRAKLRMFRELMVPTPEMRILDVGAQIDPACRETLQFIDCYDWKDRITAVNISPEHIASIQQRYPQIEAVVGDARKLPWPDKYFDIVYSNAVIEHVGSAEDQRQMAAEIMRVGKAWFVTTPNRWYPYEFHLRLPFVNWLPFHGYQWVGAFFGYDHVHHRYALGHGRSRVQTRLLSSRELRRCFPDSHVYPVRVTFWPETLVVAGPRHRLQPGRVVSRWSWLHGLPGIADGVPVELRTASGPGSHPES